MADGTFSGIAGLTPRPRLTEAEVDALCDQAVVAQTAALDKMSAAEKHELCKQAVARAWRIAGCHRDDDDAAAARADLPGIVWTALTDLAWARARARRRIRAGFPAAITLDARTLARIAINCLDSADDAEARQGRNARGEWNCVETAAQAGEEEDELEHVIVERATPDLELEAEETLASRFAIAFLLAPLLAPPVQRGAK